MKFYAFTLVETLIVLVIIGILSAILMPVAFQASPDDIAMKFKKGNSTLITVVRELVNSDEYYANGDLGLKPNGHLINNETEGNRKYFCETFAELISTKAVNCSSQRTDYNGYSALWNEDNIEYERIWMDEQCKKAQSSMQPEIITPDNISFYRMNPFLTFGTGFNSTVFTMCFGADGNRKDPSESNASYCDTLDFDNISTSRLFGGNYVNSNGFEAYYLSFCMDVDGFNKGEDPFGYGIRVDGKILFGARALEWSNKSIKKI